MNGDDATTARPVALILQSKLSARFSAPRTRGRSIELGQPVQTPSETSKRGRRGGRPRGSRQLSKPRTGAVPLGEETLDAFGDLLEMAPDALLRARHVFGLMGDPGRRTIVERLSRRPQRPGATLPGVTGMGGADIYHRLRCLRWGRVLIKDRHQIYRVDPACLQCARQYVDALIVLSALTAAEHGQ